MTSESSIEIEQHRGWKYLYDFQRGEEVVEVERPSGTTDVYRGVNAVIFKLRSQGLNLQQAREVVSHRERARVAEDPNDTSETEQADGSHLLEHMAACAEAFDAFMGEFTDLKECLSDWGVFDHASVESITQLVEETVDDYFRLLAAEHGSELDPFRAITGYGLSVFSIAMHSLENVVRDAL